MSSKKCFLTIRKQLGQTYDVLVQRPADAPAEVCYIGENLHQDNYAIIGDHSEFKKCMAYGQQGSGGGGVTNVTIVADSGTPYTVTTYTVVY